MNKKARVELRKGDVVVYKEELVNQLELESVRLFAAQDHLVDGEEYIIRKDNFKSEDKMQYVTLEGKNFAHPSEIFLKTKP